MAWYACVCIYSFRINCFRAVIECPEWLSDCMTAFRIFRSIEHFCYNHQSNIFEWQFTRIFKQFQNIIWRDIFGGRFLYSIASVDLIAENTHNATMLQLDVSETQADKARKATAINDKWENLSKSLYVLCTSPWHNNDNGTIKRDQIKSNRNNGYSAKRWISGSALFSRMYDERGASVANNSPSCFLIICKSKLD